MRKYKSEFNCNWIIFTVLAFLISFPTESKAQAAKNLEIFNRLIDSGFVYISKSLPINERPCQLHLVLPSNAGLLENRIRNSYAEKTGQNQKQTGQDEKLLLTIEKTRLTYPDLFRDGFLGTYYFSRRIEYAGTAQLINRTGVKSVDFSFSSQDTLKLDDKDSIETEGFPITQQPLPSEPFFISAIEPLIVAASIGVTVYLLFTTRNSN